MKRNATTTNLHETNSKGKKSDGETNSKGKKGDGNARIKTADKKASKKAKRQSTDAKAE